MLAASILEARGWGGEGTHPEVLARSEYTRGQLPFPSGHPFPYLSYRMGAVAADFRGL